MKMGIKEFRERFSELADGEEPVLVTKNGRIVGKYAPVGNMGFDAARWDELEKRLDAFRADWKARTPDWRARLASIGLDEQGEPIDA